MKAYTMFGIHAAIAGGMLAFVANVDDTVWNLACYMDVRERQA